ADHKYSGSFFKANPMFLLIEIVLGSIPYDPFFMLVHGSTCTSPYLYSQSLTSTKCPATAAAAAIAGLTRCVRPPRPCRPSKLRLLVEAQRSPGCKISGFMPRHIEHPDSRHSKPASMKI